MHWLVGFVIFAAIAAIAWGKVSATSKFSQRGMIDETDPQQRKEREDAADAPPSIGNRISIGLTYTFLLVFGVGALVCGWQFFEYIRAH